MHADGNNLMFAKVSQTKCEYTYVHTCRVQKVKSTYIGAQRRICTYTHTYMHIQCMYTQPHACMRALTHTHTRRNAFTDSLVQAYAHAHTCLDPIVPRYVCSRNTILSDYPTVWPKEKYAVKKDEIYDLTPEDP